MGHSATATVPPPSRFDGVNAHPAEIKRASVRATLWSVARAAWANLSSFIIFAVLARLLGPKDFGLYALAAAGLDIIRVICNAGLNDAIQREGTLSDEKANTAFTAGLILSLALIVVTAACAVPYGRLMHNSRIAPILLLLALTLPITALGNIQVAVILRSFGHKYIAVRSIVGGTVAGILAIASAYAGAGVWALVIQTAATEVVGTIVAWAASPWRPRISLKFETLRGLLKFGSGIMVTQLLWATLSRVPEFFIGRTLGFSAVGTYRVAWRAFDLIGQAVLQPIANVTVVTLARLQADVTRFRRAYLKIVGISSLIALPLIFGFGVIAPDAVVLLFGKQWQQSGVIARVVSLAAVPYTLNYFFPATLAARGESGALATVAFLQLVSTVIVASLFTSYGLPVLAGGIVVRAYVTLPYVQYRLARATRTTVWQSISPLVPAVLCSLIMGGGAYAVDHLLRRTGAPLALRMSTTIVAGAAIYALALSLMSRGQKSSYVRDLASLVGRRREAL